MSDGLSSFAVHIVPFSDAQKVVEMGGTLGEKKKKVTDTQKWNLEGFGLPNGCFKVEKDIVYIDWPLNMDGYIVMKTGSECLVRKDNSDESGTVIKTAAEPQNESGQWIPNYEGNGFYSLRSFTDFDMCMTVDSKGTGLALQRAVSNDLQKWKLVLVKTK